MGGVGGLGVRASAQGLNKKGGELVSAFVEDGRGVFS